MDIFYVFSDWCLVVDVFWKTCSCWALWDLYQWGSWCIFGGSWPSIVEIEQVILSSLDWFKGQSTGTHAFYCFFTIKYGGFRFQFSLKPNDPSSERWHHWDPNWAMAQVSTLRSMWWDPSCQESCRKTTRLVVSRFCSIWTRLYYNKEYRIDIHIYMI